MSELTFEQMLEESFKTIHSGEVVEGTVIGVKTDEIILNIGYKSDGILSRNEYTNESNVDLTTVAKVGERWKLRLSRLMTEKALYFFLTRDLLQKKVTRRLKKHLIIRKYLRPKLHRYSMVVFA